jgi:hypothetical protein
VLAPLHGHAEQIRQHLVDERLRDLGDSVDCPAALFLEAPDKGLRVLAERVSHLVEGLWRKRGCDDRTHSGVPWRVVGEQDFRPHRIRVVPRT